MTARIKISLAAAVALAGVATTPAFAAIMASQFTSAKIAVVAPTSAGALGTVWFEVNEGAQASDVAFGGPH